MGWQTIVWTSRPVWRFGLFNRLDLTLGEEDADVIDAHAEAKMTVAQVENGDTDLPKMTHFSVLTSTMSAVLWQQTFNSVKMWMKRIPSV